MEYTIREDIIEFVEKAGFIISNKEDFDKIEIRDAQNNNELLKRFSKEHYFEGSNGRSVLLQRNCVEIKLNEKINLHKEGLDNYFLQYTANFILDDQTSYAMRFVCNFVDDKNIGRISVYLINYGKTREEKNLGIVLNPLTANVYHYNNLCSSIDSESNNSQTHIKTIIDFLTENTSNSTCPQFQETIRIILYFVEKDIENMFSSYKENIQDNEEQMIKKVL